MQPRSVKTPEIMAWSQNIHLHPLASEKYPPTIGPKIGPSMGPIPQIAIAAPLLSFGKLSPIVAPPSVMAVLPAHPQKNRNAINIPRLFETAQAIVKIRNRVIETRYTGLRP
jgi:hypothetical protein